MQGRGTWAQLSFGPLIRSKLLATGGVVCGRLHVRHRKRRTDYGPGPNLASWCHPIPSKMYAALEAAFTLRDNSVQGKAAAWVSDLAAPCREPRYRRSMGAQSYIKPIGRCRARHSRNRERRQQYAYNIPQGGVEPGRRPQPTTRERGQ